MPKDNIFIVFSQRFCYEYSFKTCQWYEQIATRKHYLASISSKPRASPFPGHCCLVRDFWQLLPGSSVGQWRDCRMSWQTGWSLNPWHCFSEGVRCVSLRELREQIKNGNDHGSFRVMLFHSWWDWAEEEQGLSSIRWKSYSPPFPISSLSKETAILSRTCTSIAQPSALGGTPRAKRVFGFLWAHEAQI